MGWWVSKSYFKRCYRWETRYNSIVYFVLGSTLFILQKNKENLNDYIRVVRNLIVNTDDNSRREWSRLISSLHNLISDDNVYQLLSELSDDNKLIGFNVDQRKEEVFKAKLYLSFVSFKMNFSK